LTASSRACESDTMKHMVISALFVLAVGCKKSDPTPPAAAPGSGMQEHHEHMPSQLASFHDLIAPLWHAAPGEKRTTDTCNAVSGMQVDADAVAQSEAPATADAAKWAAAGKELVAATAAMKAPCDAKDAAGFDAAFKRVHEDFHALLAAAGGEGEHHE